jgi:hypothetical protein
MIQQQIKHVYFVIRQFEKKNVVVKQYIIRKTESVDAEKSIIDERLM